MSMHPSELLLTLGKQIENFAKLKDSLYSWNFFNGIYFFLKEFEVFHHGSHGKSQKIISNPLSTEIP